MSVPTTNSVSYLRTLGLLALTSALAFVAGCGGSGSTTVSGAINGLSVADSMSVITVDSGSSLQVTSPSLADTSDFPTGCDYDSDVSNSRVYDASLETVGEVNHILCLMAQCRYADLVNFGDYLALVDEHKCENGGDSSSNGSSEGQSSGANSGAPSLWKVHCSRVDNGSDQIVKIWVPKNEDDGPDSGIIQVEVTISAGASAENPFGVFDLNFAQVPDGGSIANPAMHGNLHTLDVASGFLGFSFFEQKGDPTVAQLPGEHAEMVQSNVNMFADQTQGVAYIRRTFRENNPPGGDTGTQIQEYKIAFDLDNVLRQRDSDPSLCLSRTTFNTRTWRYNLYHADGENAGERVELNSGFGFRTVAGDFGWMGYYGMWTSPDVTVANGDTVTKNTFGDTSMPETFTVVTAPGKLIRNTRQTLTLAEAVGLNFNWYHDNDPMDMTPGLQYRITYTGTEWDEIATWDDSSHSWTDLPAPVTIDTAAAGFMGMYSESLGGPCTYVDGDLRVTYYQQQFVNGADALFDSVTQIDLYGYNQCLDAGVTTANANQGNVYLPDSSDVNTPHHYVFGKSDLTLYLDVNGDGSVLTPAGLGTGQTIDSGPNTWGMHSGAMVTDTSALPNTYSTWNQNVFYTYETGPNAWNHYATLVDSNGDFVSFDPPIQFTYMHETANDANGDTHYDGQHFQLGYGGPGELFGIPNDQVDTDGDGLPDRFYPVFSLLDGVLMGPTGNEYVARAIDQELTLALDPGQCGALSIGSVGGLTLPTAADYTPPDIGPAPTVDTAPAVVEGVLQTGG